MAITPEQLKKLRDVKRDLNAKIRKAEKLADPAAVAAVKAKEHSDQVAQRSRAQYAAKAEIGPIPPVADPVRKERCRLDLFAFLTTYFPHSTGLGPFSDDHRRIIAEMQDVIINGGRLVNAVFREFGKALSIDTPLPTPTGWTTMGEVCEGDTLFDETGRPCLVIFTTPVMQGKPCYRVILDDGESLICSGDHLWTVTDGYLRRSITATTTELKDGIKQNSTIKTNRVNRYSIHVAGPLKIERDDDSLLVDPYILGVWLGDGTSESNHITIGDHDAAEMCGLIRSVGETITKCGPPLKYLVGAGSRGRSSCFAGAEAARRMIVAGKSSAEISLATGINYRTVCNIRYRGDRLSKTQGLRSRLAEIGVLANKHIPANYLRRPEADRWALLQGLMDTDGTVSKRGHCLFSNKRKVLVDGVRELLASLGVKSTLEATVINKRRYWQVQFTAYADRPCFRLNRKVARLAAKKAVVRSATRRIVSIVSVPSVPVRCIQVDSPSRLYLCGRSMVPTHNTTISENTILWAALYGHRQFGIIAAVNLAASTSNIDSIKTEFAENDLLLEDFPEVCYPIRELDGKPQKCKSQTCNGKHTLTAWRADVIVLPTIDGSPASANTIRAKPYAKARGVKFKRPDGTNVRPDLILVDDPQDDESAASPGQVQKNLKILKKNLIHTAGHNKKLAIVVNGTVIAERDMIESLLSDSAWQGERIKFVQSWSKVHDTFWMKEYAAVRRTFDRTAVGDKQRAEREATALYASRRDEADAGCVVSWVERYNRITELSAIQHAYNVLIDDGPEVFASEYQNQPLDERSKDSVLTAALVASKTNGLARGRVPKTAEFITVYIDVHLRVLYYVATAWTKDFTGSVIDYGTYPRQPLSYFAQASAPVCMADAAPGTTEDAWILAGLTALTNAIYGMTFMREDGAEMHVHMVLIDAKWGEKNELVKQFCRRHPQAGTRLLASQGLGIGPAQKDFSEYRPEPGTRTGYGWRIAPPKVGGDRWITIDTNTMKSHVANRLALPLGTPGGIELFGLDPRDHALFADHCVSEAPMEMTAKRGIGQMRTKTVWEWPLPHTDNHWWDCLVGTAAAASMLGCRIPGIEKRARKRRMSAAELAALARR